MLCVALLGTAGCGSKSAAPAPQRVAGDGFAFHAPAGWKVTRTDRSVQTRSGEALVSVTTFRLAHVYRSALWPKVVPELDRVAAQLAGQEHGKVASSATRKLAGRDARVYEIVRDGASDERIGFVLDGRREYQLFCREPDAAAHDACDTLLASFRLA